MHWGRADQNIARNPATAAGKRRSRKLHPDCFPLFLEWWSEGLPGTNSFRVAASGDCNPDFRSHAPGQTQFDPSSLRYGCASRIMAPYISVQQFLSCAFIARNAMSNQICLHLIYLSFLVLAAPSRSTIC